MKASFLLENLLPQISFLNNGVSSKIQLPILSNVLIKAKKEGIKIYTTDLETGIEVAVPASVAREGEVAVPAKTFSEYTSSLTEEKITIEKTQEGLVMSGKSTTARLNVMDEKEFPKVFEEKGEEAMVLGEEDAKKLSRVVFAASTETGRPAFSGVLIRQGEGETTLVATDSHRLSLDKVPTGPGKEILKKGIIVPVKTIRILLSRKGGGETKVYVSEKNNQVTFAQKDATLVGRLIEADYPEYEKIIPQEHSTRAIVDREEFLLALKTAAVFARENSNIIKLSIKKDSMSVSAKSPSLGENSSELPSKITGEENEIAFNGRYLLDLLQNIDEEEVIFEMTGPLNPGVFKTKDPSFIHLIMPIRVKDEELPH